MYNKCTYVSYIYSHNYNFIFILEPEIVTLNMYVECKDIFYTNG